MEMVSQDISKITEALCKFKLAVGPIPKNKKVSVPTKSGKTYEFAYADLGGIISVIDKPLAENGLTFTQIFIEQTDKTILRTILMHISGQSIHSDISLSNNPKDTQELGGEITYLARYSLSKILGVCADDDIDGNEAPDRPTANKKPVDAPKPITECYLTPVQVELVSSLIGPDEVFKKSVLNGYNVTALTQLKLTPKAFDALITGLKKKNEERLKTEMAKV